MKSLALSMLAILAISCQNEAFAQRGGRGGPNQAGGGPQRQAGMGGPNGNRQNGGPPGLGQNQMGGGNMAGNMGNQNGQQNGRSPEQLAQMLITNFDMDGSGELNQMELVAALMAIQQMMMGQGGNRNQMMPGQGGGQNQNANGNRPGLQLNGQQPPGRQGMQGRQAAGGGQRRGGPGGGGRGGR